MQKWLVQQEGIAKKVSRLLLQNCKMIAIDLGAQIFLLHVKSEA